MPRFYILSGADLGSQCDLAAGQAIGRASDSDWVLRDASISRRHALVEQRGARWFLVDAGSRNGLWLGEQKHSEIELVDGLELSIGDVEVRVRIKSASAAASQPIAAHAPAAQAIEVEEIQLEELEPEPARAPSPSPPPANPARAPQAPQPASAPAARRTAPGAVVQADRGILQYQKHEQRAGLLHSDLAQQPWYVRLGWILVALLLAAALGFFAFRATGFFKHKVQGDPELESNETR